MGANCSVEDEEEGGVIGVHDVKAGVGYVLCEFVPGNGEIRDEEY